MDSRAQFEEYFKNAYGLDIAIYPNQTYVREVWEVWQTSRAAMKDEMPLQHEAKEE